MANVPTPRSRSQIIGDMLDAFLSKTGLPSVRVGSPTLSIIEAGAQSDLRNSQDIFNLLNSNSLDRATGLALDRIGADEDTARIGESPASGFVTISDTSFSRLETRIFQGQPAPIVGSDKVYVTDALDWPASGELYIGRGTTNYEGPLTYTSKVDNTNYWTLNLDSGSHTTKYHNLGESVILAQGGNRLVAAGTLVQTPQGNAGSAVQFSLLYSATIPDGETEIQSVTVVARTPGVIGNIIAGSINAFVTPPFTGASVTNGLPYSNGLATEDDNTYRERIRAVRQSRSRGTPLAIKTAVTGITALDENKRVISANVVTREGYPTTLYVDDGTGYEEKDTGIPLESIADQALGGEQYFQLVHGRPVTKAYSKTNLSAPFSLESGMRLSIRVGGVLSEHDFSDSEFRSISSASAYELAASINGNEDLLFAARTTDSGTRVAVFAKSDTNEDIEVVDAGIGFLDANSVLGFPAGRVDTLRLYKNDVLLSKDGQLATLTSTPQGLWGATASGETFAIRVDGVDVATTPVNTYTITDADFVNAGTGYTAVSSGNDLESWAQVLNYKIPGITAAVSGGALTVTSNRGRSSDASLEIQACTLVTKGLFAVETSTGKSRDYTLDRNLGQIRLEDGLILHPDDKLTAGSLATRAFLESEELSTITISSVATSVSGQLGAEAWFVVDGAAELIPTGIGAGTPINITLEASPSWGDRVRIVHTPLSSGLFENAAVGDWLIVQDSAVAVANRGAWRIADLDTTNGYWVEVERPAAWASPESVTLSAGDITVVRSTAQVQRVFVTAAANYTAASLATAISSQLQGATATVYRTNRIRVRTNSFLDGGDIALVAANSEALKMGLEVGVTVTNETSHLAALVAGNPELGTPQFSVQSLSTVASGTVFDVVSIGQIAASKHVVALKSFTDAGGTRYSNGGHSTPVEVISGTTVTTREAVTKDWLPEDRIYAASHYALTGQDEIAVVLDGDTVSKRFVSPMFRRLKAASGTWGITTTFKDADNANLSLAKTFGTTMDWRDFAVFMKARTKSHRSGGLDTNKTLLWRYHRWGPEGNRARLQFTYPTAASQTVLASCSSLNSQYSEIFIRLPSGAARTGVTYTNATRLGHRVTAGPVSGLYTYTFVLNLPIASAEREVRLNYNSKVAGWSVGETVTGASSSASGTISAVIGGAPGAASGTIILTGVTGTFQAAENLNGSISGLAAAVATAAQYTVSKLTLTLPAGVTDHGFTVGNALYMAYNGTGTGAGFGVGIKTVLEVPSGTQINYLGEPGEQAPVASVGTTSYDTAEAKTTGSTVVVGDIFNVGSATSLPASFQQSFRLLTLADGNFTAQSPVSDTVSGTLLWAPVNATANLSWFPVSGSTITAIAAAVNAQGDSSPVSAVAVGDGLGDTSGSVLHATYEASPDGLGGTDPWYYLADGINYVRSHTVPPNDTTDFTFTLKLATDATLATNSDFLNEDARIVPITAESVAEYLDTAGPGGLFASGELAVASRAGRPQIATLTVGSAGSVQVQGGTANALTATVQGTANQVSSTYMVASVNASDTVGMAAGHWARLQNSVAVAKARIDANTTLTSIASNGNVVFNAAGTKAWDWATTTPGLITGKTWQIEKHGNFTAFAYVSGGAPSLAGVQEGDWVHVSGYEAILTPGLTGTVNTRNRGLFRVVRVSDTEKIFWVENTNTLEETATADLAFLTYDSIVPGDDLLINTSLWGVNNLGTWAVASIDLSTYNSSYTDDRWKFRLDTTTKTPDPVGAVAALGSASNLVQVIEKEPSHLFKQIHGLCVNPSDSSYVDIKFDSWAGGLKVSEAAGTIVSILDKLAFDTDVAEGIDGYRHSTGLIAEANKVGYGDESDPSSYPGVIAAGANVNIEGPLVRRVSVSLALRVRTGISTADIKDQVRSAAAATINGTGVGVPVAISDIISAAQAVNGVISVTVLSPSFGPGTDLISVQPYEKPLVLNLDDDITISFVGE